MKKKKIVFLCLNSGIMSQKEKNIINVILYIMGVCVCVFVCASAHCLLAIQINGSGEITKL